MITETKGVYIFSHREALHGVAIICLVGAFLIQDCHRDGQGRPCVDEKSDQDRASESQQLDGGCTVEADLTADADQTPALSAEEKLENALKKRDESKHGGKLMTAKAKASIKRPASSSRVKEQEVNAKKASMKRPASSSRSLQPEVVAKKPSVKKGGAKSASSPKKSCKNLASSKASVSKALPKMTRDCVYSRAYHAVRRTSDSSLYSFALYVLMVMLSDYQHLWV